MKSVVRFFFLLLLPCSLLLAQADLDSYRQARATQAPQQRVEALQSFLDQYPNSAYRTGAYSSLFAAYLELGREHEALKAADNYTRLTQGESNLSMAYNNVSYELALKGMGLDTALAYANRAVAYLRSIKSGRLNMVLDTKAYVLYALKRYNEAEKIQEEAIVGHEKESDYVLHLALYQEATGQRMKALRTVVGAMLLGDYGEPLTRFNEWIAGEQPNASKRSALRQKVVMEVLDARSKAAKKDERISERSKAALVLANTSVKLPTALSWAKQAVRSLGPASSVEDVITYKKNLGAVLFAENKLKEAENALKDVGHLVPVWQTDFWLMTGRLYEKMGKIPEATDAYLTGLLGQQTPELLEAVARLNGSKDVKEMIQQKKESLVDFEPGHFNGKSNGNVVLAELFTGAECGPCQSADFAFDKLAEYYPRSVLAILEYHVHIPGPDPMTTDETFDRYSSYGNTGTPAAYFEGGDRLVGGGPKYVGKNRFEVYKYAIEKHLSSHSSISLKASAVTHGDAVAVEIAVGRIPKGPSLDLHTALVERSIDYTGSNGVSKHLFVVRDLADGAQGMKLTKRGAATYKKEFNIDEIDAERKAYLDNPVGHRSWRLKTGTHWKGRPETLNPSNLAVVVWIQNPKTMEVMQAYYTDVPVPMGMK